MPKLKSSSIKMRLPCGTVVRLTTDEYYAIYEPGKLEPPKRRRKRCTFLPGVNPEYDAKVAAGIISPAGYVMSAE